MDGMNRVYLLGHLGSDPKTHQTKEGKAFCRLSIAVSRNWSFDTEGKSQRKTDWHSVLVWGRHGQTCAQYLKKGSAVLVEGYLSSYQVSPTEVKKADTNGADASVIEGRQGTQLGGRKGNQSEGRPLTQTEGRQFPETKVAIHAERVTFLPDAKTRLSADKESRADASEEALDLADLDLEPKETNGAEHLFSNADRPRSTLRH